MNARTIYFFCISLGVVVIAWLILTPNFIHSGPSETGRIYMNLRRIDGATAQWVYDHHSTNPVSLTRTDIAPYLINGWVSSVRGELYVLRPYPGSPEAHLTHAVERLRKGTIVRLGTNSEMVIVPPK
jgi:hypothetical protein